MRDVQRKVAETISAILNAPLVALYAFVLIMVFLHPATSPLFFATSSFFGSILPLAIFLYMVKKRVISDVNASERQSRTKPFIYSLVSLSLGIIGLILLQAPAVFISFMACYLVNSFALLMITQVWKISIHASGITGPAIFLLHQLGIGMFPFFILLFPVGWARLKLKAHDSKQVVAGALVTAGLTILQLIFYPL